MAHALLGHRDGDDSRRVPSHQRDRFRRDLLGSEDKVALVLPIFVVDQDDHLTGLKVVDGLLDRVEHVRCRFVVRNHH